MYMTKITVKLENGMVVKYLIPDDATGEEMASIFKNIMSIMTYAQGTIDQYIK